MESAVTSDYDFFSKRTKENEKIFNRIRKTIKNNFLTEHEIPPNGLVTLMFSSLGGREGGKEAEERDGERREGER